MIWRTRDRNNRGARLQIAALALALAVAGVGAGCGSNMNERVAAVGKGPITGRAVNHWAAALESASVETTDPPPTGRSWTQRAVDLLISSRWLMGEASRLRVAPTRAAIRRRLHERIEEVPGGRPAFVESLRGSQRTVADVELEVGMELAVAALRRIALDSQQPVSLEAIEAYYRAHEARYRTPERRYIDIVEKLRSPSAARAVATRFGSGSRLARIAYHEVFERPASFAPGTEKGRLLKAVFEAQPGVLSVPMRLNHAWAVFVVRRIVPAGVRPLRSVRHSIRERLRALAREEALARFAASLRQRWRPSTSCQPRFVVPKCAQYKGPAVTEANLLDNA